MTVTACVLGPDNLAPITDPEEAAADVGLATLAAITHSNSGQINDILEALAEALNTIDTGTAGALAELTAAGLADTEGLPIWRALMATPAYPYTSPLREWFREEGLQEGRQVGLQEGLIEGERGTVRMVLKARGLKLSDSQRERLDACTDLDTLRTWSQAALTADTTDDVFK